jgi:hypothetical protein
LGITSWCYKNNFGQKPAHIDGDMLGIVIVLAIATRLLFLSTLAQEIWHGSE